jgi:hypothetical protein
MSPSKCPNPTCPFLFDPSQVPPGAVIACPRCGLRFTLAPMPPAPAYPGYAPVPGYGMPPAPPAEPESAFQEDLFASTEEPTEKAPRGKKAPRNPDEPRRPVKGKYGALKSILFAVLIVTILASLPLGFIAMRVYNKRNLEVTETSTELKYPDLNLQFQKPAPDSGWTKHDGTRMAFNAALFGYQRGD